MEGEAVTLLLQTLLLHDCCTVLLDVWVRQAVVIDQSATAVSAASFMARTCTQSLQRLPVQWQHSQAGNHTCFLGWPLHSQGRNGSWLRCALC